MVRRKETEVTNKTIPFVAIGNDELGEPLAIPGQLTPCPRGCGRRHRIIDSKPPGVLQAVRCGRKSYLVGIKGRMLK